MVSTVFTDLFQKGALAGIKDQRSAASREWYRKAALRTMVAPGKLLTADASRLTTRMDIGSMYLFKYDPKTKDKLPYYDTFPLVFPINTAQDGFLGINMHYLALPLRAQLMDALHSLTTDKQYTEKTSLAVSYKILNGISRFRFFKPCLKHYLTNHMQTRFFKIMPNEWNAALFLNLQQFKKASSSKIWRDSANKIGGL